MIIMTIFRLIPFLLFLLDKISIQASAACVGLRRADSSYDFNLDDAIALHVQDDDCDAEWTIDQMFTAILDGKSVYFSHPFKNATNRGISVFYCPNSVKYHVGCPKYANEFTCSCTNYTNSNPGFSTTTDIPLSLIKTGSSMRNHYVTIAVVATFALTIIILAFLICSTTRGSSDEDKPGLVEVT